MSDKRSVSRRDFFRAGAAVAAVATVAPMTAKGQDKPDKPQEPEAPIVLPRRKLGRSGVEVTILSQGTTKGVDARYLNVMHSLGVRYIDAAKSYQKGAVERALADWFQSEGPRKEYFLVTKDQPMTPADLPRMIDERLAALKTDYIDLFFLHGLGDSDGYHGLDDAKWFTDPEWVKAVEAVRKSGKARLLGFSIHADPADLRAAMLNAAAKGGWVDAIMVSTDPILIRQNAEFNKALDACHKAGIGLISMKQGRGTEKMKDIFPTFEQRGLTPYTAMLMAMWTDERFTAVCSLMRNLDQLRENALAAKNFKPLTKEELGALNTMFEEGERTFCVACDGSCRRAAGTQAQLNRIARYVSYAEQDGRVYEAAALLKAMPPEDRDWSGADLAAASRACKCRLDYARVIARAEELLA